MVAQLFNLSEKSPNENLFLNSGWQQNTNNWSFTWGNYDTTVTFDGCNSIKSVEHFLYKDKQRVQLDYSNDIVNVGYGAEALSVYIYSPKSPISKVKAVIMPAYYYNGKWKEGFDDACKMEDLGNNIFKASYIFKNTDDEKFQKMQLSFLVDNEECYAIYAFKPKLEYGEIVTDYRPALTDNINWDYDKDKYSFQSAKAGDIAKIQSYNYKKSLTTVGTFSMSIPKGTQYVDKIKENTFIYYDGDWLIVNNVKLENNVYKIEGTDCKGLLAQRITLGEIAFNTHIMRYDIAHGPTEFCLKHFILNNIVNPIDPNRKIPLFTVAKCKDRGNPKDTYLTRLEPLNELAEKMCKNANIGYDVYIDLFNNKIIFDVVDITDKTINQRERNQIVFEKERENIASLAREKGNSNYKNIFYANKSGGNTDNDVAVILTTRDSKIARGINRREMQLNVSCDSVAEIESYAKPEMVNYEKTNSLEITGSKPYDYGKLYTIGDKVTIRENCVVRDAVINGVDKTISNGQRSIVLEFGESKLKPFKKLEKKINQKGV